MLLLLMLLSSSFVHAQNEIKSEAEIIQEDQNAKKAAWNKNWAEASRRSNQYAEGLRASGWLDDFDSAWNEYLIFRNAMPEKDRVLLPLEVPYKDGELRLIGAVPAQLHALKEWCSHASYNSRCDLLPDLINRFDALNDRIDVIFWLLPRHRVDLFANCAMTNDEDLIGAAKNAHLTLPADLLDARSRLVSSAHAYLCPFNPDVGHQ